jgi:hypothetical protein
MDFYKARSELKRMSKKDLFNLGGKRRISKCLIGGRACGLFLHYKGFTFCVSEIMGEGCQVQRSARTEGFHQHGEKINYWLPLTNRRETSPFPTVRTNVVQFKVYCRDCVTRSMIFLGDILEKRTQERGNNLRDLLIKAMEDYKDCVANPSMIFILGS